MDEHRSFTDFPPHYPAEHEERGTPTLPAGDFRMFADRLTGRIPSWSE